ncbi:hypothetical protein EON65_19660 [archaeon]|nr:MAG: hypothetical protein EON65_19660 [archaeon]
MKDLLYKSVDTDIAYVPEDVLLSNINMLLTNLPMDAYSLLSEEDDGIGNGVGMTGIGVGDGVWLGQGIGRSISSYPPPTPSPREPPIPKQSTEERFWALVMTLFMNVCAPHSQCKDSINVIEGKVNVLCMVCGVWCVVGVW